MFNFLTSGADRPHFIVKPGNDRQHGIYSKVSDAAAQIKDDPSGIVHMFPSLESAMKYWFYAYDDLELPLIHSVGKYETLAGKGQLVYVGDDGLKISRYIQGETTERVQDFIRYAKPIQ